VSKLNARVEKDRDANCSKVYGLPRRALLLSPVTIKQIAAKGREKKTG